MDCSITTVTDHYWSIDINVWSCKKTAFARLFNGACADVLSQVQGRCLVSFAHRHAYPLSSNERRIIYIHIVNSFNFSHYFQPSHFILLFICTFFSCFCFNFIFSHFFGALLFEQMLWTGLLHCFKFFFRRGFFLSRISSLGPCSRCVYLWRYCRNPCQIAEK